MQSRLLIYSVMLIATGARSMPAAFNYSASGSTYIQDFNSLAATGVELPWTNDSTIVGWHLFRVTTGSNATPLPMVLYDTSNGSSPNGRFYSFGTNSDRALGGIGGGTFGYPGDRASPTSANAPVGWIAASITNSTGIALNKFTLSFAGEQWRDAGDNEPPYAQTMAFQYGFGNAFSTVSSWTSPGSNFNFTSPVFTTNDRAINGNGIGHVAGLGGTISSLSWPNGETLWLRWIEQNDLGQDHAMAIDDFSFSATGATVSAVPEPGMGIVFGAICCLSVIACGGRALFHSYFAEQRTK